MFWTPCTGVRLLVDMPDERLLVMHHGSDSKRNIIGVRDGVGRFYRKRVIARRSRREIERMLQIIATEAIGGSGSVGPSKRTVTVTRGTPRLSWRTLRAS